MNILKEKKLYFFILSASLLLVFAATGGGLTGSEGWWQHQAFNMLCHQDPTRSFWINGSPMAVCSRCFGIYSVFTLFWMGLPMTGTLIAKADRFTEKILLLSVILNVVDVIGNLMGFWQNTLLSRFLLGSSVGMAVVLFLGNEFVRTSVNINKREI